MPVGTKVKGGKGEVSSETTLFRTHGTIQGISTKGTEDYTTIKMAPKSKGKEYGIGDLRAGMTTSVAHKSGNTRDHEMPDRVREEARSTESAASIAAKAKAKKAATGQGNGDSYKIKKRRVSGEPKDAPINPGTDVPMEDEDDVEDERTEGEGDEEAETGEPEEDPELTPPPPGWQA